MWLYIVCIVKRNVHVDTFSVHGIWQILPFLWEAEMWKVETILDLYSIPEQETFV